MKRAYPFLALLLLLSVCGPSPEAQATQTAAARTATAASWAETPTLTPTHTPTVTPSPTATLTPTPEVLLPVCYSDFSEYINAPRIPLEEYTSGRWSAHLRQTGGFAPIDRSKLVPYPGFVDLVHTQLFTYLTVKDAVAAMRDPSLRPFNIECFSYAVLPDGSEIPVLSMKVVSGDTSKGFVVVNIFTVTPETQENAEAQRRGKGSWDGQMRGLEDEQGGYAYIFFNLEMDQLRKFYNDPDFHWAVQVIERLQAAGCAPSVTDVSVRPVMTGSADLADETHIFIGIPESYPNR